MPDSDSTFCWTVHPARERPLATLAALAVIVAFGAAVFAFAESRVWGVAATAALILALNRFFFPSEFAIGPDGVRARLPLLRTRALSWAEVRRVEAGSRAVWLSTYPRRHWREYRRGVHVLFGRHGPEVMERLRHYAADVMSA